jgi:hypothetical protein
MEEEEELQKMAMAEEEEVASMQSAWEPLQEESPEDLEAQAAPEVHLQEELFEREIPIEKTAKPEAEALPLERWPQKTNDLRQRPEEPKPRKAATGKFPEDLPPGINPNEVKLWLKALENPSRIIRKNAAQFLKKLTGKDYDYE